MQASPLGLLSGSAGILPGGRAGNLPAPCHVRSSAISL